MIRVGIIGATGAVGRECLSILESRRFPADQLRLFASPRSAGQRLEFRGRAIEVEPSSPDGVRSLDIAFFAAGSAVARSLAPIAAANGARVIDKSSAHREDPACPLVIPEINAGLLAGLALRGGTPGIIAVPNCSTIILMLALEPLRREFGLDRVVVSTYQAASGAGAAAMDELESQTRAVLAGGPAKPRVFNEPCAFNVFSHDSPIDAASGSNGEERKMASEARRIWESPGLRLTATCVRVGVMRGHSESINVRLTSPASEGAVRAALLAAPWLTIVDDRTSNAFPTPLKASGGDHVLVGRIRPDGSQDSRESHGEREHWGFDLFVSGDQLRIGAALTAVNIAERLL